MTVARGGVPLAGRLLVLRRRPLRRASETDDAGVATTFSDLLRAHEEMLAQPSEAAATATYRRMRASFQRREGRILDLYWGTDGSGVAITAGARGSHCPCVHRVSDHVTADAPAVAATIQDWEILAVRARRLRGSSADVLVRWIFAATVYLVGAVATAPDHRLPVAAERELRRAQAREIAGATAYYEASASYTAYIDYFWGMMVGVLVNSAVAIGCVQFVAHVVPLLWPSVSVPEEIQARAFGAIAAGAIGSLLSVMLRMSAGNFPVNHDIGRMQLVIIGSFRPFIGAVSGLALFLVLGAGVLGGRVTHVDFYVIAIAALLAGFSERFARGAFLEAERAIIPSSSGEGADGKGRG